MRFALLITCLAALLMAAPAAAADRWAGTTRAGALATAKHDVVGFFVVVDGISPANAAKVRGFLDRTRPRKVERIKCFNQRQAWKIVWPTMDALYVARRHLIFVC